jgi:hypothetical protein
METSVRFFKSWLDMQYNAHSLRLLPPQISYVPAGSLLVVNDLLV